MSDIDEDDGLESHDKGESMSLSSMYVEENFEDNSHKIENV